MIWEVITCALLVYAIGFIWNRYLPFSRSGNALVLLIGIPTHCTQTESHFVKMSIHNIMKSTLFLKKP